MFKKEDEMPKGAFGNFREVQARRRQRRRTDRQGAEVAKILVAFDRRCANGCDRAAFGAMVVEVFPQLGPLDGEAVDAAFAECRRLVPSVPVPATLPPSAPEAIVEEDPNEAAVDLDDISSEDADAPPPAPPPVAVVEEATPLATPRDAAGVLLIPRHHAVAVARRYRDFVQQRDLIRKCWAACRGGARIDASQLQTALTVAERKFAADRARRHPSSGAQDVDEATAADILQRVASDGDTQDRNDFGTVRLCGGPPRGRGTACACETRRRAASWRMAGTPVTIKSRIDRASLRAYLSRLS